MRKLAIIVLVIFGFGIFYTSFGIIGGIGFDVVFGIILLIITAVVWRISVKTGNNKQVFQNEDDSLNILKERYAKGEITKEEFEEKKKDLSI